MGKDINTSAAGDLLDVTPATIRKYVGEGILAGKVNKKTGRYSVSRKDVFCLMQEKRKKEFDAICSDTCSGRKTTKKKGSSAKATKSKQTQTKAKKTKKTRKSTSKTKGATQITVKEAAKMLGLDADILLLSQKAKAKPTAKKGKGKTTKRITSKSPKKITAKKTTKKTSSDSMLLSELQRIATHKPSFVKKIKGTQLLLVDKSAIQAEYPKEDRKDYKKIEKIKKDLKYVEKFGMRGAARKILEIRKKHFEKDLINSQYRSLSKIYHPDKISFAEEYPYFDLYFKKLTEARDYLLREDDAKKAAQKKRASRKKNKKKRLIEKIKKRTFSFSIEDEKKTKEIYKKLVEKEISKVIKFEILYDQMKKEWEITPKQFKELMINLSDDGIVDLHSINNRSAINREELGIETDLGVLYYVSWRKNGNISERKKQKGEKYKRLEKFKINQNNIYKSKLIYQGLVQTALKRIIKFEKMYNEMAKEWEISIEEFKNFMEYLSDKEIVDLIDTTSKDIDKKFIIENKFLGLKLYAFSWR